MQLIMHRQKVIRRIMPAIYKDYEILKNKKIKIVDAT